ncbi:hypothetical protein CATRI_00095 [Corynebacterium atrinae]|uniref:hypothetical protein n=1 Tax=Corynebacterium atrinae TaxID=1336740 RepID=UPI0025B3AA7A|nr:hypothetical protein [Corynebacterium atrinae]WJY62142.1 hypothetical protein CATRI_00095 [Corynebacterium atrinae]
MDTPPQFIHIHTAATRYGISLRTLHRRLSDGLLTRYRQPGNPHRVLLSVTELDALFYPTPQAV